MTQTLYMMRGLPGSGKSTRAREICLDTGAMRVNKDDLREMLYGGVYDPRHEYLVHTECVLIVDRLLERGLSVVVDNTNMRARDEGKWQSRAEAWSVEFVVVDVDTPLEVCVQRDRIRGHQGGRQVGEDIIREYARRFGRD